MNKNAATEREYEFSYDTLVDIITAQQALVHCLHSHYNTHFPT